MISMNPGVFMDPKLEKIAERFSQGGRLNREDGITLFETHDLLGLGRLADDLNRKKNKGNVYYINNIHVNYSNVCAIACKFCAFRRSKASSDGAFYYTPDEVIEKARDIYHEKACEVHIVGGNHPSEKLEYYTKMVSGLRQEFPKLHVQAFTAVEIEHIANVSGISVEAVLTGLQEAGLGSLPGGGAEIFDPQVRNKICPGKISGEKYLDVMRKAHGLGLPTNVTMLFGHIESYANRVDHMLDIRNLQDETGGFNSFIPLLFHPWNTRMADVEPADAVDIMKTMAVSRLMLDNIDHIKSFWIMIGIPLTQMAIYFGSDDVNGTVLEEHIIHEAGASTPEHMPEEKLVQLIRETGRTPVERDTLYKPLSIDLGRQAELVK